MRRTVSMVVLMSLQIIGCREATSPAASIRADRRSADALSGGPSNAGGMDANVAALAPVVGLNADQHFLNPGETSVLTWSAANATSCRAGWTASRATNGSQAVTPVSTKTYTVTCTGPGGSASASTTVNVANLTPAVGLDTDQHFLNPGETSVLVWTTARTTTCHAPWTASKATSGNQAVTPASTTTYTVTCMGPGGSAAASTTVNVAK